MNIRSSLDAVLEFEKTHKKLGNGKKLDPRALTGLIGSKVSNRQNQANQIAGIERYLKLGRAKRANRSNLGRQNRYSDLPMSDEELNLNYEGRPINPFATNMPHLRKYDNPKQYIQVPTT
mmetsp:Transcript_11833/g.16101  ORF Transcript_11833/g.16101 Transcript_11833/m.16101 type:complete len:120 (-) Transcript_11833:967-1326(-)